MAAASNRRQPRKSILQIDVFRGIDLNNAPSNVELTRSPDAPNMVRGEMGKVRKRQGYEVEERRYDGRINGVHSWNGTRLVHAGSVLYWSVDGEERSYPGVADARSRSRVLGGWLCLIDGESLLLFDGEAVTPAEEAAYIPTLTISRKPGTTPGGAVLEPYNLLSRFWREQFLGDGSGKVFALSAAELDSTPPVVEQVSSGGEWVTVAASSYTVDYAAGRVTFAAAPSAPPVAGQDNIRITAAKTREDQLRKILGCTVMETYGVGGSPDRLFLSGNPEHPGLDFYSELNDPTYFGDTWYSNLGQDGAAVVGYSRIGDALLTHKQTAEGRGGIIIRTGVLADEQAAFPVAGLLTGEAAISPDAFGTLGSEPFFLTRAGVYSITAAELTGERYAQQRSFYIAPALQREPDLAQGCAVVWKDFYVLSAGGGTLYLLDGLQKTYRKEEPYSTHQCECYVWTGIDARVLWTESGRLCFGTPDGRLCRFFDDAENPASYYDDGLPIHAWWDTPDLSGSLFYRNKTFRELAVRLQSAVMTGVYVKAQRKGLWYMLWRSGHQARYFDWSYIDLGQMVFSADRTPKTLKARIRLRRVDKTRFRLGNDVGGEPFGLYSVALEYSE